MFKVYKYEVPIEDFFSIEMPLESEILCVANQYGRVFIWALINSEVKGTESRHFRLAGTGHYIDATNIKYIGTVQQMDGALVWHLFELI